MISWTRQWRTSVLTNIVGGNSNTKVPWSRTWNYTKTIESSSADFVSNGLQPKVTRKTMKDATSGWNYTNVTPVVKGLTEEMITIRIRRMPKRAEVASLSATKCQTWTSDNSKKYWSDAFIIHFTKDILFLMDFTIYLMQSFKKVQNNIYISLDPLSFYLRFW
jgi:hypothetical protein